MRFIKYIFFLLMISILAKPAFSEEKSYNVYKTWFSLSGNFDYGFMCSFGSNLNDGTVFLIKEKSVNPGMISIQLDNKNWNLKVGTKYYSSFSFGDLNLPESMLEITPTFVSTYPMTLYINDNSSYLEYIIKIISSKSFLISILGKNWPTENGIGPMWNVDTDGASSAYRDFYLCRVKNNLK